MDIQGESRRLIADEAGVSVRAGSGRPQASKQEWPIKLLGYLGLGVLVGLIASLRMVYSGRLTPYAAWTSNSVTPSSRVLPSQDSQAMHHSISDDEHMWQTAMSPQRIRHNMSDDELLWRASMVPQRPRIPIKRTPKIAFMFLTVGPLPLGPLWDLYFQGHEDFFSVYVHGLPGFVPETPQTSVFYGRQVPSQEAKWGEISIIDAERRLLANALLDFSNEYFVLISETCVPLFNFTFTYDYITNSKQSFIQFFDDPGPHGRGRYNPQMLPEVSLDNWRKGSQWFEVNRKLAIFIIADVKYYPKLRDFCKPHCYVDEHYIPTMLFIEFQSELASRSITFTDWSRGGSHPAMFGKADVTKEFLTHIREDRNCVYNDQPGEVCSLFARKFSPNALEHLLKHSPFP